MARKWHSDSLFLDLRLWSPGDVIVVIKTATDDVLGCEGMRSHSVRELYGDG